jgi:hypothetical protein
MKKAQQVVKISHLPLTWSSCLRATLNARTSTWSDPMFTIINLLAQRLVPV